MKLKMIAYLVLTSSLQGLTMTSAADSRLDRIATSVLAERFGVPTRDVIVLQRRTELSIYALAPIYEGSIYFERSPVTIWKLRHEGYTWREIADRVGMSHRTFDRLLATGVFDEDVFWESAYCDRFGVPYGDIVVLRRDGCSLEDVLASIVLGGLLDCGPRYVYAEYCTRHSWLYVTNRHHVRFEDWERVGRPSRYRTIPHISIGGARSVEPAIHERRERRVSYFTPRDCGSWTVPTHRDNTVSWRQSSTGISRHSLPERVREVRSDSRASRHHRE